MFATDGLCFVVLLVVDGGIDGISNVWQHLYITQFCPRLG